MKKILYYGIKTINIIITVSLVFVCVFSGYLLFCNISGMDVPTLGPFKIYIVLSDSMVPVMRENDAVIMRKTAPENLKTDDIIAFYAFESDEVITHRIIGIDRTAESYEFSTQGDNNDTPDSFITPDSQVIGKYTLKIPQFGRFIETTSENIFILIVPAIVLMALQFLSGMAENNLNPNKKPRPASEADNIIRAIYENRLKSQADFSLDTGTAVAGDIEENEKNNEETPKNEEVKNVEEPEQKDENNA